MMSGGGRRECRGDQGYIGYNFQFFLSVGWRLNGWNVREEERERENVCVLEHLAGSLALRPVFTDSFSTKGFFVFF